MSSNLLVQFRVKVTPVEVDVPESNNGVGCIEESWDVQDVRSAVKIWPIVEVAVIFSCYIAALGQK